MNDINTRNKEYRLRPHHIWGLFDIQENPEKYYQSDSDYISSWRLTEEAVKYSKSFILHARDVLRVLYENPDFSFVYISGEDGSDTLCSKCDLHRDCYNPKSSMFLQVKEWDTQIERNFPVFKNMKFGEIYTLKSLNQLKDLNKHTDSLD